MQKYLMVHLKRVKISVAFLVLAFAIGLSLFSTACEAQIAQPGNTPTPPRTPVLKKNVLVLYAFQSDLKPNTLSARAIQEEFSQAADLQVNLYFEYLDLSRFSDQTYQDRLVALLNQKYMQKSVDLVIIANQMMIQWWPENRARILPETPVVFFDIDHRNLSDLQLPPDFTGVSGFVDYIQSVKWYLGIRPAVNEIVVVHGMGPVDLSKINYLPVELLKQEFSGKVQVTDISNLPLAEIKKRVASLPPTSVLVYHPMFQDANGISYPINILHQLTTVSSVPVIGAFDIFIGEGVVGGYMYSIDRQARDAVGIALRILRGEKPADIPVSMDQSNVFIFDHPVLQRYDIPLTALPAGAAIKNRQYSFWELYQPQIIAAIIAGIVLLVMVLFLLLFSNRLFRARRSLINLNASLETQVEKRTIDLRETNSSLEEEITERRRVEADLRESEARLREVLENSLDVSYKRNLITNAYEYLSPVFAHVSGYTADEIISLPVESVLDLIHPQDRADVDRVINMAMSGSAGTAYQSEYRFKHKNGYFVWFHDQYTILKDEDGQPLAMIGSVSDVTERKKVQLALQENDLFINDILNSLPEHIAVLDERGVIIKVNTAWMNFASANICPDPNYYIGINYLAVCDQAALSGDENAAYITQGIRAVLDGSLPQFSHTYPCHSPAAQHWFAMTVLPQLNPQRGLIILHNEITEQKIAEFALKANEQNFRSLAENTLDGIVIVSTNWQFVYANQNAARFLGYSLAELLQQAELKDIVVPEGYPQLKQRIEDRIAGRPVMPIFETILQRKDGKHFEVEIAGTLTEWQGQPCDLIFFRDISERKRAEAELRRYAQNTATFYDLSQQIHTNLDLDNIYEKTHQAVSRLMTCDAFVIALLDSTEQIIEDVYLWDRDRRFPGERYPRGMGLSDYIISSGKTLCVNEWNESHASMAGLSIFGYSEEDTKSVLCVPLFRTSGACFGMVSVQSYLSNQYFEEQEQLLVTLANQVSKAIENTLIIKELQVELTERKRVEEELGKSEEKYRTLFENKHTVMLLIDPNTGQIVDANPAACAFYGYSRQELDELKVSQLNVLPDDMVKAEMEKARQEQRSYFNFKHRLANGEIRDVEVFSGPIILDNKQLLYSVIHDDTERINAENALKTSEAKYRLLAENMADVVWILDLSGQFTYVSQSVFRLRGFTPEEVIKTSMREAMTPDSLQSVETDLPRRLRAFANGDKSERVRTVEIDQLHKNGSIVPTEVVTNLITNDQGQVTQILGVSRDISERKQVEAALRESEERYRILFEDAIEGIVQSTPQGKYINVNQSYVRIFGYDSPEEMVDQVTNVGVQIYAHPEDRARLLGLLASSDRVENFEAEGICKDGRFIWCSFNVNAIRNTNGELIRLDSRLVDITQRKLAEISLQQKTEELDRFFNIALDLLCIADTDGYFRHLNEAWETTLGYPLAELEGNLFLNYVHPDDIQSTLDSIAELSEQKPVINFVNRYRCKDGTFRWIEWRTAPFGKQIYAAARDITERKLADAKILEAQAELETRVKERTAELEAANHELEAFSYSISHDLRTPLRSLDGFSGILLADYQDKLDEPAQNYLMRIRKASRHMWQLTEDLLALSHITRMPFAPQQVDLSTLAREVAAEFESLDPQRKVNIEIAPNMVACGDPNLLKIVYENLLNNAFKFTGQIEEAHIQVGVMEQAGETVYFVRDNGSGFDMAYAGKLFAPFERLHNRGEFPGTGIGLATVKRIITRHGGRIWPDAELNRGATFYFTLGEGR